MKKFFVYGGLMFKHKDKLTSFPGYLNDYKISFKVKGFRPFEPSFATLEPKDGDKAYGVVLLLSEDKLRKYTAHELSYEKKPVIVMDMENNAHECVTLLLKKLGYEKEVTPSARYAHVVYKGGLHHGLPEHVLNYYQTLKTKGHKLTYYLRFLFPLFLKLVPIIGRNFAFYGVLFVMPISLLIIIITVCYKIVFT